MHDDLLSEIERFLAETGMSGYRFGYHAVRNGRLVERLRKGDTITLRTAERVRAFIAERRRRAAA